MRGAAIAFLLVLGSACGSAQIQTTQAHVPSIAGKPSSFDDLEIDQAAQRIYAADRTDSGIDVFDVAGAQPRFLATIKLPSPPNGLAIAPAALRLYAGTAAGTVEVIDTATLAVSSEIKTGASEVDLIDYAAGPNLLFAGTGVDGSVLTIDAATDRIIATGKVGKPVEQPRFDPASGLVYVAAPELDALVGIDPRSGAVKRTLKLNGCIPTGLAIKPAYGSALIACRKSVWAYDLRAAKGNDLGRVADGDVVQYFAAVDRFFVTSPHEQVPTVVGMFGGDPVAYVGSLNIGGGGNAAVYDLKNDSVYTSDPRAPSGGLTGFRMDGSRPVPLLQSALETVGPFVLLALLVVPLWLFLGRRADPVSRRAPVPRGAPAVVLARPAAERPEALGPGS